MKNNAKKKTDTPKRSTDIPLENIPDRKAKTAYTDEFKLAAVQRVIAGESGEAVARAMNIPSSSVVHKWRQLHDAGLPFNSRGGDRKGANFKGVTPTDNAASMLKMALENARRASDDRLEAAACIVEADGNAPDIAKKIRALKRQT